MAETEANLGIAQQELAKAHTELEKAIADLNSLIAALNATKSRVQRYQTVAEVGALTQNQLEEAQLQYEQQKTAIEAQKATIEGHHATIERQKQAIRVAQQKLKQAQNELNPSDSAVKIAREKIEQTKANAHQMIANLTQEKQTLQQQTIQLEQQLQRDRQQLQQFNLDQKQMEIRATVEGIIKQLYLKNTDQVVEVGEKIAEILPNNSSLIIKTFINPQDIQKIQLQQIAILKISACPYPNYGTLSGEITDISQDTLTQDSSDIIFPLIMKIQLFIKPPFNPKRSLLGKEIKFVV